MTEHGRARQWRGWRGAALAGSLAVVVTVAGIWIAGNGQPPPAASVGNGQPFTTSGPPTGSTMSPTSGQPHVQAQPAGLRLSAGHGQQIAEPVKVVQGKPLPSNDIIAILDRLPTWTADDAAQVPFRWPAQTLTTPQAGKTITIPLAGTPKPTPPQSPTGPLHVLRMQPQGAISVAPFASITFDQPMVPVATIGQLAGSPATISPKIAGTWQWIGTSTVRFAADSKEVDRLPMATTFTITVPAGTRSQNGAALAKAATATFSTPAPTVQHFQPSGKSIDLDAVFVAVFDQRVDPAAVLKKVTVTAAGTSVPIREATAAEVAADAQASRVVSTAPAGRLVAFRPVQNLKVDQALTVAFGAGTPSTEGPRTTTKAQTYTGRTYAALALQDTACNFGSGCEPSTPFVLTFTNPLDTKAFDPTTVKISPEIPGRATITADGQTISVQGATQADTTYTITVPTTLTDTFGQHLPSPAVATFKVGKASPRLDPFPNAITTLDPLVDSRSIVVNTLNRTEFRERVFAVSITDWPAYQNFYKNAAQQDYSQPVALNIPDWPVLLDRTVTIGGSKTQVVSTKLDLSSALHETSQVVVLVEPTDKETFDTNDVWQNRLTMTWAQATNLGLDALNDTTNLKAWVTDLRNGSPIDGVTVGLLGANGRIDPQHSTATGADGVASLALTAGGAGALLATKGTETALLPSEMWQNSWMKQPTRDQLLWFVTDDRQTYRPGETVSVKGWVRQQDSGVLAALNNPSGTVNYSARDAYGVVIGHGNVKVSALGGFDLKVAIPAGANLGDAMIELSLPRAGDVDYNGFTHPFEIADFRTPDFEVDAHADSGGPYVVGDDLTVAADATYYAGGPLGDSPVEWQVRTAAASYAPPGWTGYTFGIWTPWWQVDNSGLRSDGGYESCCAPANTPDTSKVDTLSGRTDANGHQYLQVKVGDLGKDFAGLPVSLTAQATVTDVNRQPIAGTADLLVHPADYYVGLTSDETFVTQGKDLVMQAIATDIDGTAVTGRTISVRAAQLSTSFVNGVSVDTESNPQTCTVTSGKAPVSCTFRPSAAGTYRVTATITDDKGRVSRTELTRWVAGPDGAVDSSVQLQQLTLVPDKKEYQPGQSAKLLVQSPIRSGSGLVTVLHNGIVSTSKFVVADGSAVVTLPVSEEEMPSITASIEVVGTTPRSATDSTPRPAYATGEINLTVSTQARTLMVTAVPREKSVAPGGKTTVDVTVADQNGKPLAGSEFELVVADEAVLALGGAKLADPLDSFYPELSSQLNTFYARSTIMLGESPQQQAGGARGDSAASSAAMSSAAGAAVPMPASSDSSTSADAYSNGGARQSENASAGAGSAISERKNFDALALFVPSATTDANGKASIAVPLPDSLTRYRVMVVAVAGTNQFGSAESTITAALPLTVRPSAPRFLNFGDTLELPVLLQNQTDAPLTTDVVIQAANLKITGSAGQQVTVPAQGRIEVHFPVSADQAGTAKFRVAAVSGSDADAASVELPVYTPTTTETFASYGVLSGGETLLQKVTAPKGVVSQFGGLDISTSSTALQQLTDAVGYLADYDYQSSDGYAAQIIAIGSLADVLKAFSAPGLPSADDLKGLVTDDVKKLIALQNDDGGFPYWQRGDPSDPFNSIQSTQALVVAAKHGFVVSSQAVARAQDYLGSIGQHIPADASQATRDTLRAFALNVLMLSGRQDVTGAQALYAVRGTQLPLDAVAWLLPVVTDPAAVAALERVINNAAVDNAGSVTFTNKVTDDAWTILQSDRRTDGLILDALISVQPASDLIPKVVAGLMAGQTGGRWSNVQENAFILLALRHYYDAYEGTAANFVAGVWLGDRFAGQHTFTGHTTDRATVSIPTSVLVSGGNDDVTLQNKGTGRLYYRLGLQTAPTDLKLAPLDRGFVVSRTYQAVDNPADVTRDASGTWHIKAGARVKVQIEMVSRSAQTHVALTDPLPAGLEILNPDLATTPKDLAGGSALPATWNATWYDHQNLRDQSAEAFASYLQGGVYEYSYLALASTDGSFVAPPPRAEQVYAPETFGRGGSDRVVIAG